MAAAHSTVEILFPILLAAAFGIAMIMETIRQKRAVQRRSLDLQALSSRLDFDNFNPHRDDSFTMGWGFLSRLSRGDDRYAFNILRGRYHEQPLFVFDYHYGTGSGKNRREHYGTILMLVVKEAFPKMTIRPETLGEKIETAFGIGDAIKFESAEFSRTFCVQSKDKKFAYDVCSPQMIEYLLTNHGLGIEIQGPVISLAFEPQLPVAQIEFNLQRLAKVRSLLPEYLFTQNV